MENLGMVVLNYNDYKTTIKFLEKVKSYKNIARIIVVDNNSTDDSVGKIKAHIEDNIELIVSKENKGYGSGNNLGIVELQKDKNIKYISISNPDIEVEEEDIDKLIEVLKSEKDVAVVAGRIIENEEKAIDGSWKIPNYSKCLLQTIPGVDKIINNSMGYEEKYYDGKISYVDTVKGCFFIAKADVLKEIENFDDDTFLYYEENILGKKIKDTKYKVAVLNNVNIIHAHGATINKNIKKIGKYKALGDSRLVYIKKYLKVNNLQLSIYKIFNSMGLNIRYLVFKIQDLIKK